MPKLYTNLVGNGVGGGKRKEAKTVKLLRHPTDIALVIQYEVESGSTQEKVVKLSTLCESTNVSVMAERIMKKNKMIHMSQRNEVEKHLYVLQKQIEATEYGGDRDTRNLNQIMEKGYENRMQGCRREASIDELEDYTELLYECEETKLEATKHILQLANNVAYMEDLLQSEATLAALARVLKDEYKKNMEVTADIVFIFLYFSNYSQFHVVLQRNSVGITCIKLIKNENDRCKQWQADIKTLKKEVKADPENSSLMRHYKKTRDLINSQLEKQSHLLNSCFHLLLNLAEDVNVEVKMRKKNIIELLCKQLDARKSNDLLKIVCIFLKKLSIFKENKNEMTGSDIIGRLNKLLPHDDPGVTNVILRLLLNLSFDEVIRSSMAKNDMIRKLATIGKERVQRVAALSVLYHLSMDKNGKSQFTYTDSIPMVVKMLLELPNSEPIPGPLIALCINLMTNQRNAEIVCERGFLKHMIKRVVKTYEPLLMKMIRNIAMHEGKTGLNIKTGFLDHIETLMKLLRSSKSDDFLVELVGLLGSLSIDNFDFKRLVLEYHLIDFINSRLNHENNEDDLLLEMVIFVGTITADDDCAAVIARAGVVQNLIELLNAKQEDDEMVLQIVYVFYQMIFHLQTREVMLNDTEAVAYLIDLMHDKNAEIRNMCDTTLDIIMEFDEEKGRKIRYQKFQWHNAQWLEMIQGDMERSGGSKSTLQGLNPATEWGESATEDDGSYSDQDDDDDEEYIDGY